MICMYLCVYVVLDGGSPSYAFYEDLDNSGVKL